MDDIAGLRLQASPNNKKKNCLQHASYHDLDNAFYKIWVGADNPHGIHLATPLEVLHHMIQKGSLHDYSLNSFIVILANRPI
jgi:hypothetical protein